MTGDMVIHAKRLNFMNGFIEIFFIALGPQTTMVSIGIHQAIFTFDTVGIFF